MPAPQLVGANGECAHCPVHGLFAEPSGRAQTFAEPYDSREGIDDSEAVLGWASDEKSAIVGTEVDGAIGVAIATSPVKACWRCRRTPLAWERWRSGDIMRHSREIPFYPSPRCRTGPRADLEPA